MADFIDVLTYFDFDRDYAPLLKRDFQHVPCGCKHYEMFGNSHRKAIMLNIIETEFGPSCRSNPDFKFMTYMRGQFIVSRRNLLRYPVEFYEKYLNYIATELDVGYAMERMWTYFFDPSINATLKSDFLSRYNKTKTV